MVSGIRGIDSPIFHDRPIVREYNSLLDEARVAIHEWLTRPYFFNTIKLFYWLVWLATMGMNPVAITWRHYRSLQKK